MGNNSIHSMSTSEEQNEACTATPINWNKKRLHIVVYANVISLEITLKIFILLLNIQLIRTPKTSIFTKLSFYYCQLYYLYFANPANTTYNCSCSNLYHNCTHKHSVKNLILCHTNILYCSLNTYNFRKKICKCDRTNHSTSENFWE